MRPWAPAWAGAVTVLVLLLACAPAGAHPHGETRAWVADHAACHTPSPAPTDSHTIDHLPPTGALLVDGHSGVHHDFETALLPRSVRTGPGIGRHPLGDPAYVISIDDHGASGARGPPNGSA